MFISAGNDGPGVNTIGDPGVCGEGDGRRRVHHEGHVRSGLRRAMPFADNLHYFSSRGPREDGGFKPSSSRRARRSRRRRCGRPAARSRARTRCRPATRCSTARRWPSPQAAGAAALLVSAAKQAGRPEAAGADPAGAHLVGPATSTTARFQAYEQGNGLIDVGAAWDLLKTNIKTVDIIVVGSGEHDPQRLPRDARASAWGSTTARVSPLGAVATRGRTRSRGRRAAAAR